MFSQIEIVDLVANPTLSNEYKPNQSHPNNPTMSVADSRFSRWFAVVAFSSVALTALITDLPGNLSDEGKTVKWSASAISISLAMSALAWFAHMLIKDKFVGTHLEGGMVSRVYRSCSPLLYETTFVLS